jgi:hypothetical protein
VSPVVERCALESVCPMVGRRLFAVFVLTLGVVCWGRPATDLGAADTLPLRLSDREFWTLIDDVSEANGSFRSDNLLSNELQFQHVIGDLTRSAKAGRAYLGVGPEQNFTYIAALRPSIAFIVDIRRGNLDLHLLYKALFELADTRAEFVSLLFSKPQASGLSPKSTAQEIFDAFAPVPSNERLYTETMARVRDRLFTTHHFELSDDDLRGIEYVFRAFFMFGADIKYSPFGLTGGTVQPTYAALMAATDERGQALGFLANDERFMFVRNLQARNLIVPVVGNFAGPRAIGKVGAYLKERGAIVSAFYLSNVEEYLRRDGLWQDFCANVSALPVDATSTFIRSVRAGAGDPMDGLRSELGPMSEISNCR